MRAGVAGHIECVKLLIQFGASWAEINAEGKNAMTAAREARQRDVLLYFMEMGASEPRD